MKNLFENAYFGKAYKTRDGRKAIYIEYDKALCKHAFFPDKHTLFTYCFDNGMVGEFETCVDIVSEWSEEIDEEELKELARHYIEKTDMPCRYEETAFYAFISGYRKAKEEQK